VEYGGQAEYLVSELVILIVPRPTLEAVKGRPGSLGRNQKKTKRGVKKWMLLMGLPVGRNQQSVL
jgi:hypothetical protein